MSFQADEKQRGKTIVDLAVGAGSFKTLLKALEAAGLVETLSGAGPFTVFAPTDEAFSRIPKEELERLLKPENVNELKRILLYHVVPGMQRAAQVVKIDSAASAQGQTLSFRVKEGRVFVNDAQVTQADLEASNGVVHVVDQVLIPKRSNDLVDVASASGSFKTLLMAVEAAGLVETLRGKGPFTVFAPTDEAFAKLPAGALADLLKPENKAKLQAVLTYHVLPVRLDAAKAMRSNEAATVNGRSLGIRSKDGKVFVGDAQVVKADIAADNGVIHVIDTVLLPE